MKDKNIRVRFAPSPTGPLHIGGVRTALYNFLFARQMGGKLILRIEDTDQHRFVPGAEHYILESLAWCGIQFDEDVVQGGPYAPYRQSERSEIYRQYIQILLEKGHAYYAFDTESELELRREEAKSGEKGAFQYDFKSRNLMQNALTLSGAEVNSRIQSGQPYVIRIKIPENEVVSLNDLIRGEVTVNTANLDDKVLFKSDGLPTYHLANVVDDYLMKITHVIRGEEWLPSAPLHVLLYRFFGWESTMPRFAHLPLILKPDGNGKLSKRDGDRLGFPVFPIEWKDPMTGEMFPGFREAGYIPEAFINILVHLGWNPGTDQEIFSIDELIENFSIDRIGKSGSKFDPEKAKWFNHQFLTHQSDDALYLLMLPFLEKEGVSASREYVIKVIRMIKERVNVLPDLWNNSWFFFIPPRSYDEQVKNKIWKPDTAELIGGFIAEAEQLKIFNHETLYGLVVQYTGIKQVKTAQLMNPLRLLTVGSNQGPGMMDIAETLGQIEFISRIKSGLNYFLRK